MTEKKTASLPPRRRRGRMPWATILFILAASLVITWAEFQHRSRSNPLLLKGPIPWRTDFESARQEAVAAHKPMLVNFGASWCGPCQQMEETTWQDRAVADALKDYVPVSIDIDQQSVLAEKYQVNLLPTVLIIDPVSGQAGRASMGALGPMEFLDWLAGKTGPSGP